MLLAAGAAIFAPLLDLLPQAGQFAFQGLYFTGVADVPVLFAQFQLEILEFMAQPVQLLAELSFAGTLFPVVIPSTLAMTCILYLIFDLV